VALLCAALLCTTALPARADHHHHGDQASVKIDKARYEQEKDTFKVKGETAKEADVALTEAGSGIAIATVTADDDGKWEYRERHPNAIPCRVRATSMGQSDERRVEDGDSFPGGCGLGTPPPTPEICTDGVDNDGNSLIDCADPACANDPACQQPPTPEICTDGIDNDGNGLIDCADPACANDPACQTPPPPTTTTFEAACNDGQDNDGDGAVDCADPDCVADPACNQAGPNPNAPKNSFNIMMNYELGMHCTGFEFAYCCVLPPYNSILAQVVKTEKSGHFPKLLEADPNVGLDGLGRPTVVRDTAHDGAGNFKKYQLRYWHDAQPRNDGQGAPQTTTLISLAEGNSLLMWNTKFDAAVVDANGALVTGTSDGATGVIQGNGSFGDANDNYINGIWNHLYIYKNGAGNPNLEGANASGGSLEKDKIRLGVDGHVVYPDNTGAALHPLGPGVNGAGFDNVLTFSGDTGTVVYTQSKVLDNLPVMLTSPRIWEALGLPLTPFEDTINFFGDPGAVNEGSIRPYVRMKAQLEEYPSGNAVLDNGRPVVGFGTAPIDIPNCERCHALAEGASANSAQNGKPAIDAMVQDELDFWNAYYNIDVAAGDSDWYSRLKAAAVSMLAIHDAEHGTSFTSNFPGVTLDAMGNLAGDTSDIPQNTRLGHQTVACQRCHADNVIAVVKSAYNASTGGLIPALSEALHDNHKNNPFSDSLGRNGGCQGCHPAHRSDGTLNGYPITELGLNAQSASDNRDAAGGCFVGRDVHSNRNKDADATTPSHMNAVGQWLVDNVANDTGNWKGIWCTNCHSQLGQELWKADSLGDHGGTPFEPNPADTLRDGATLADIASGLGISMTQATAWLDPKTNADTAAIWSPNMTDASVAIIEVGADGNPVVTTDGDGDPSVRILEGFCTTPACMATAQATLAAEGNGSTAVAVPFSAATDGRDHWLSPGEPHCADCHKAPYVENSGDPGRNPYPPFNYPGKYALFRYSRGHQDITCQGCHESIHGLYPTTQIDTTSYNQAASMNPDGSHGPLKCAACHQANSNGVIAWADKLAYKGTKISGNFDTAVSWMHTFDDAADPTVAVCRNCHDDKSSDVSETKGDWLEHTMKRRVPREIMDKVEVKLLGHVSGATNPLNTVCRGCHDDKSSDVRCSKGEWLDHLSEGRVSQAVWEAVSTLKTGGTCGY